jgi:oligoendopeptidase F
VIKDLPAPLAQYPMTLAETASIFAETVVFEEALKETPPEEKAGLLENNLQNGCQILVDILSRFYFEKSVFSRRPAAELGRGELCSLMKEAQEATYGDGLDKLKRHPYMWAVKSHYYDPDLAFYNFPYAFGLLFGLGLYARTGTGAVFCGRVPGHPGADRPDERRGSDPEGRFQHRGHRVLAWGSGSVRPQIDEFEELAP